jgi:cytoskeletal protein CcmA (bactofilin family)
MFNRDALFGKKDDLQRNDSRAPVNVTPGLGGNSTPRPQPALDAPKADLRLSDVPKATSRFDESATGSKLIVGPNIKLRGVEITDCDTLVVEGRVEASMDSRVIQVAENGIFAGTVSIDVAEIRGRFEGELTARKQLVIYSTGRVNGQIRYGKIRIEEGGEVTGDVSTLARAAATAVKEISLTGAAPILPAASASAAASSPAQPGASGAAPAAGSASSVRAQLSGADAPSITAAALREPAPSRGPRSTSRSSTNA